MKGEGGFEFCDPKLSYQDTPDILKTWYEGIQAIP